MEAFSTQLPDCCPVSSYLWFGVRPPRPLTLSLGWADASNNELGFKVERRLSGGTFAQIATPGANTTSYTDTGLADGTTYCYQVRAFNAAGESAPSQRGLWYNPSLASPKFYTERQQDGQREWHGSWARYQLWVRLLRDLPKRHCRYSDCSRKRQFYLYGVEWGRL